MIIFLQRWGSEKPWQGYDLATTDWVGGVSHSRDQNQIQFIEVCWLRMLFGFDPESNLFVG